MDLSESAFQLDHAHGEARDVKTLADDAGPSHNTGGPDGMTKEIILTEPQEGSQTPNQAKHDGFSETSAGASMVKDGRIRGITSSEIYQIRQVSWKDSQSSTSMRKSPIMIQNANGPCPLLALVNALIMSTPADVSTVLVQTLATREQISLGLLLDAVIDELMSGRRAHPNQVLPDVSNLYAFLVTLHTGMNVNPRFVCPDEINETDPISGLDAFDQDSDLRHSRSSSKRRAEVEPDAGDFERTREVRLYQTFSIPLYHGWLPAPSHPSTASLVQSAQTYEDAQNIMFREAELESKLKDNRLGEEETILLKDIQNVKFFLSSTATQLTDYGLQCLRTSMNPGSIAILFRNDHFNTLYRHPDSGLLLTVVTDMGYAQHDEIVWQSLTDVSGENSRFYTGDFRLFELQGHTLGQNGPAGRDPNVSIRPDQPVPTVLEPRDHQLRGSQADNVPITSSKNMNVQENEDYLYALKLQEEEEARRRSEAQAQRRREDELSQRYLRNTSSTGRRTFPGFSLWKTHGPASQLNNQGTISKSVTLPSNQPTIAMSPNAGASSHGLSPNQAEASNLSSSEPTSPSAPSRQDSGPSASSSHFAIRSQPSTTNSQNSQTIPSRKNLTQSSTRFSATGSARRAPIIRRIFIPDAPAEPPPPPTYEQAAQRPVYHPDSHPHSPARPQHPVPLSEGVASPNYEVAVASNDDSPRANPNTSNRMHGTTGTEDSPRSDFSAAIASSTSDGANSSPITSSSHSRVHSNEQSSTLAHHQSRKSLPCTPCGSKPHIVGQANDGVFATMFGDPEVSTDHDICRDRNSSSRSKTACIVM